MAKLLSLVYKMSSVFIQNTNFYLKLRINLLLIFEFSIKLPVLCLRLCLNFV